jgi:hypothetical protein
MDGGRSLKEKWPRVTQETEGLSFGLAVQEPVSSQDTGEEVIATFPCLEVAMLGLIASFVIIVCIIHGQLICMQLDGRNAIVVPLNSVDYRAHAAQSKCIAIAAEGTQTTTGGRGQVGDDVWARTSGDT